MLILLLSHEMYSILTALQVVKSPGSCNDVALMLIEVPSGSTTAKR